MIILESIGDIGGVVLTSGGDVKSYDVTCIATMPNIYFVEGILGKKILMTEGSFHIYYNQKSCLLLAIKKTFKFRAVPHWEAASFF